MSHPAVVAKDFTYKVYTLPPTQNGSNSDLFNMEVIEVDDFLRAAKKGIFATLFVWVLACERPYLQGTVEKRYWKNMVEVDQEAHQKVQKLGVGERYIQHDDLPSQRCRLYPGRYHDHGEHGCEACRFKNGRWHCRASPQLRSSWAKCPRMPQSISPMASWRGEASAARTMTRCCWCLAHYEMQDAVCPDPPTDWTIFTFAGFSWAGWRISAVAVWTRAEAGWYSPLPVRPGTLLSWQCKHPECDGFCCQSSFFVHQGPMADFQWVTASNTAYYEPSFGI